MAHIRITPGRVSTSPENSAVTDQEPVKEAEVQAPEGSDESAKDGSKKPGKAK